MTGSSGWGRRLANDELRLDLYKVLCGFASEFLEKEQGGGLAHLLQGLPDRRQARNLKGRGLDVVEAENRNILGYSKPGLVQGTDTAHRRDIVEAEHGGKVPATLDELANTWIANLWRL